MSILTDLACTENPLMAGTSTDLLPQPSVLVIFGAAGDLAWRKLLPAVANLSADGQLPSNFAVVGFGLGAEGDPDLWIRNRTRSGLERFSRRHLSEEQWRQYAQSLFFVPGSFDDARAYAQLRKRLEVLDDPLPLDGHARAGPDPRRDRVDQAGVGEDQARRRHGISGNAGITFSPKRRMEAMIRSWPR